MAPRRGLAFLPATRGPGGNAIERTLLVLEAMAMVEQPIRLSDLAQHLGIPKSATHRILASMVERGWAEQSSESDCYGLTLRMALIGQRQLAQLDATSLRQPILDRLAARTRELVRLTAIQKDGLAWVGSARGRRSGLVYEPDMTERVIPFTTANGKIWLASLADEQAVRIALDAGLGSRDGVGPNAITTVAGLLAELALTRRRGYGLALEEAEPGVGAVAVLVDGDAGPLGTMSVAAPITRLGQSRIETLVRELRPAADAMQLAWHAPPMRQESSRG